MMTKKLKTISNTYISLIMRNQIALLPFLQHGRPHQPLSRPEPRRQLQPLPCQSPQYHSQPGPALLNYLLTYYTVDCPQDQFQGVPGYFLTTWLHLVGWNQVKLCRQDCRSKIEKKKELNSGTEMNDCNLESSIRRVQMDETLDRYDRTSL